MFYPTIILFLSFNCNVFAFRIRLLSIQADERINLMIDLIDRCLPNAKGNFLISDSSTDSMYKNFYKHMIGSVTLFNRSVDYKKERKTRVSFIIMMVSSPLKVKEVLANDTWRDFNQFFIILDGGDSDNGCVNAQSFLMEAWKNDILNTVFMCLDQDGQVPKVYSFNPFTDFAPISWEKMLVLPAIYDHPWTMLGQIYDPNHTSCSSLFFEKTDKLGGYLIKVGAMKLSPFVSYKLTNGTTTFEGYDYEVIKLILEKLNATTIYNIPTVIDELGNTTTGGVFWLITQKKIDLLMTSLIARGTLHKAELTYPYFESKISVISQQRKFNKLGGHLFAFLPSSIAALFFITSTLVFILLRIVFNDPYSRHILDILRVFLNIALPTLPFTSRGRIIFGVTLVSFSIANIVIQANMNTVLTSKNAARNVESFKDLKELNYEVCAPHFIKPVLINDNLKKVKIVSKNMHCSKLKKNEAFVGKEYILRTIMTKTCHLSKKPLVSGMFNAYYTRRNWPIFPKITKQLLILFETGMSNYHIEHVLRNYQRSKSQEPEQYQVISMDHMSFTFSIFVALSLVSLIIFFFELNFERLRKTVVSLFWSVVKYLPK
ncbi:uncharacterized protein LOC123266575 [Cotesia glomerata]|uniref:uncharacterized protein LOC123266575 n=1 Tax=Cotesia glomerata TaxID=32391 RepID=UPI001D019909|nr:uncharacterized protein LOC123266575 [Cotesia glomerata]